MNKNLLDRLKFNGSIPEGPIQKIIPNIKSGGCQGGGLRLRYQPSPVLTQSPDPIA